MGGSSKDHRDVYYRLSKIDGYRARSAYKLLHLDEQYGFFGQPEAYTLDKGLKEELSSLQRLREQRRQAATTEDDEEDLLLLDEEIEDLQDVLEYAAKLPSSSTSSSAAAAASQQPRRPTRAVDLCAAPGSWSQVLVQRLPPSSHIVSVDLQPMAPIPGVRQILGDITTRETAEAVAKALAGEGSEEAEAAAKAQLIVCDGSPDVTGIHSLDEMLQAQLLLSALQITMRLLEPGGTFIAKIFCQGGQARAGTAAATAAASASASLSAPAASHVSQETATAASNNRGNTSALLVRQMKELFELVDVAKPRSSRIASHEHFIVCRNFRPPPSLVTPSALATPLHDLASHYLSSLVADPTNKEVRNLAQTTGLIAGGDLSAWMERPVARRKGQQEAA